MREAAFLFLFEFRFVMVMKGDAHLLLECLQSVAVISSRSWGERARKEQVVKALPGPQWTNSHRKSCACNSRTFTGSVSMWLYTLLWLQCVSAAQWHFFPLARPARRGCDIMLICISRCTHGQKEDTSRAAQQPLQKQFTENVWTRKRRDAFFTALVLRRGCCALPSLNELISPTHQLHTI